MRPYGPRGPLSQEFGKGHCASLAATAPTHCLATSRIAAVRPARATVTGLWQRTLQKRCLATDRMRPHCGRTARAGHCHRTLAKDTAKRCLATDLMKSRCGCTATVTGLWQRTLRLAGRNGADALPTGVVYINGAFSVLRPVTRRSSTAYQVSVKISRVAILKPICVASEQRTSLLTIFFCNVQYVIT